MRGSKSDWLPNCYGTDMRAPVCPTRKIGKHDRKGGKRIEGKDEAVIYAPITDPGKYGNQKLKEMCDANRRGLLAGCICRINLSVMGTLLKADEAGSPIDPSNDVPEREHATKARSAIVMEPMNSVGIPVERYSKYK